MSIGQSIIRESCQIRDAMRLSVLGNLLVPVRSFYGWIDEFAE